MNEFTLQLPLAVQNIRYHIALWLWATNPHDNELKYEYKNVGILKGLSWFRFRLELYKREFSQKENIFMYTSTRTEYMLTFGYFLETLASSYKGRYFNYFQTSLQLAT